MILATVRFTAPFFHKWAEAPPHRKYLASLHRHLLHIEVSVEVTAENRQIEFHDLLDRAKLLLPDNPEPHNKSCETVARELAEALINNYGERYISVSVFEDGEVGATYIYEGVHNV